MKFVYPEISQVVNTASGKVNTVIVENQGLFYNLLMDINGQINGNEGKSVLSDNDKRLEIKKHLELISDFVLFEMNKKTIINKICSIIEENSKSGEEYVDAMQILADIEDLLGRLSLELPCGINYSKLSFDSLIKAVGIEVDDTYGSIGEKLIDYMELVNQLEREKLYITVNMRCFIPDDEFEKFCNTVIERGINIIMLEGYEHKQFDFEQRIIIDQSLCEI